MIPLNLEDIKKHLASKSIPSELQQETEQLCAIFKLGTREFPLFIRIYGGGELLQLLAFIPCNPIPEAIADTARLLHVLNKQLDLPGFGMDEENRVIFYRCMVPVKNKKIDTDIFDSIFNAVHIVTTSFMPVIAAVALGTVTCDDVLKQAQEQNQSLAEAHLKGKIQQ